MHGISSSVMRSGLVVDSSIALSFQISPCETWQHTKFTVVDSQAAVILDHDRIVLDQAAKQDNVLLHSLLNRVSRTPT